MAFLCNSYGNPHSEPGPNLRFHAGKGVKLVVGEGWAQGIHVRLRRQGLDWGVLGRGALLLMHLGMQHLAAVPEKSLASNIGRIFMITSRVFSP